MDLQSLLATLQSTLSPDSNVRIASELRLVELSTQPQTGVNLAQILVEASLDVSLRQAAGFSLKKYIKERWSPFFQTFKGGQATSVEEKEQVRQLVFKGLDDPVRKVRLACAVIISDIAHPDWPDDWPTLMNQLLQLITGSPLAVDGGMRVLNDFVGIDLTEDQLLPIAREMLPHLLAILGNPQVHSPSTRARAILIFKQCVMTLFTVKDEHPAAVKAAITEIMPQWLDAFRVLLEMDVAQDVGLEAETWEGLAVRIAIFGTLEIVLNSFPSTLKSVLPTFLNLAFSNLASVSSIYHTSFLSSSSDFSPPQAVEEDSSVPADLPTLVSTIIDFVTQAARRKSVAGLFVAGDQPQALMVNAIGCAIDFGRMTTDDEDSWASDPNAFIADEDDEMVSFNVRSASLDFVVALVETFEEAGFAALWDAFKNKAAESDASRARSEEDWWKVYESALALVGAVASELLDHVQERAATGQAPTFDLGQLFSSIVPSYLGASDFPFLQGRSYVFASQFSKALPAELSNQYIDAAIAVLGEASASVPVKVSAVRALDNFFRHLGENVDPSRAALTLSRLLPLLPQTTENTLILLVDAVRSTLKAGGQVLDAATASGLVKTVLTTWFEKPEDPLLGSAIGEMFEALAKTPSPVVQQTILGEALPALTTTMTEIRTDPFSSRASSALDIVESIFDGFVAPLAPGVFAAVAGVLFEVLGATEDRDILQTGIRLLTTVVRKDVSQLLSWHDASGRSGLELVLSLVARLLDPSASESGGLFVGDLVMHLIRTAGTGLAPVLPDLLKAFVTRLATAETPSFSQSLILPFAYLIHTQADTVLSLLEGVQVASGRPALEVLLTAWCDNVDVFQGYWGLKVSTVAMVQLFSSARPSLQRIQVKGDLLLTDVNSKNPDQFPPIPFHAKALKVLLHDVQNSGEDATFAKAGGDVDAESDDGDDEWADEGGEFASGDKDLDFLSDMLGADSSLAKYMADNDSDAGGNDDGEEDLKDDPIYTLDIQQHLLSFFQQAYETNTNSFRQLAEQYLTPAEKDVLAKCLQSA
ncbi:Importin 9 [Pseudohyphozyma bogoriensis]|nr:Importin 9 [Pseudohyphozyma bogoriensis]